MPGGADADPPTVPPTRRAAPKRPGQTHLPAIAEETAPKLKPIGADNKGNISETPFKKKHTY
jgi:hypothetical protein